MHGALDIRGSGTNWAVFHGQDLIAHATSHGNAIVALTGIERRLNTKSRPCLCCRDLFQSTGIHHRLCATCKKEA